MPLPLSDTCQYRAPRPNLIPPCPPIHLPHFLDPIHSVCRQAQTIGSGDPHWWESIYDTNQRRGLNSGVPPATYETIWTICVLGKLWYYDNGWPDAPEPPYERIQLGPVYFRRGPAWQSQWPEQAPIPGAIISWIPLVQKSYVYEIPIEQDAPTLIEVSRPSDAILEKPDGTKYQTSSWPAFVCTVKP